MVANSKLQEVEVTAHWHNIWLGCTLFFFVTTALFAGLFGGFYSAWQNLHECTNLKLLNDGLYDESRHCLVYSNSVGIMAMEGGFCPNKCDKRMYDTHMRDTIVTRRLSEDSSLIESCYMLITGIPSLSEKLDAWGNESNIASYCKTTPVPTCDSGDENCQIGVQYREWIDNCKHVRMKYINTDDIFKNDFDSCLHSSNDDAYKTCVQNVVTKLCPIDQLKGFCNFFSAEIYKGVDQQTVSSTCQQTSSTSSSIDCKFDECFGKVFKGWFQKCYTKLNFETGQINSNFQSRYSTCNKFYKTQSTDKTSQFMLKCIHPTIKSVCTDDSKTALTHGS